MNNNHHLNFNKTIFISAYREVSVRYLIYSDIFKELCTDKKTRLVILVDENNLDYYSKKLNSKNVIIEPIFYNNGFYFLKLVEIKKSLAEAKDFSKFREQIIFDYQNYEDDQAFIKYI